MKLVGVLVLRIPPDSVPFHQLCSRFLPLLYREISKKSPKCMIPIWKSLISHFQSPTSCTHWLPKWRINSSSSWVTANSQHNLRSAKRSGPSGSSSGKKKWRWAICTQIFDNNGIGIQAKFVTDPAAAIVEKQRRHKRKQAARMRRLDELKPYRAFKRRRREEAIRRAESPPPME